MLDPTLWGPSGGLRGLCAISMSPYFRIRAVYLYDSIQR